MPNLVGIGLSQVPTNSMLGGLAYQSPDHASIKDLDLKNLSQINSEIADTAVDIFVYDTSKDSDGGAWRKRTQHTSWYNETLNTATRGSRREFPAVAVIVISNASAGLTIYDGDDPDLPMWMVFNETAGQSIWTGTDRSSVAALNGIIVVGQLTTITLPIIGFVADEVYNRRTDTTKYNVSNIAGRNTGGSSVTGYFDQGLVNATANDVAMTVLPNAPIDPSTGLPIPTIAVATDGGVSVIRDDGTVSDLKRGGTSYTNSVQFTDNNSIMLVWGHASDAIRHVNHYSYADWQSDQNDYDQATGYHELPQFGTSALQSPLKTTATGIVPGVLVNLNGQNRMSAKWDDYGLKIADLNDSSRADGMVCHIRSDSNSGWMHGDIKGAFLSDTDTTNVTGTELWPEGDFADANEWSSAGAEWTISGGTATVSDADGGYSFLGSSTGTLTNGKKYVLSFTVSNYSGGRLEASQANSSNIQIPFSANGSYSQLINYTGTSGSGLGMYGYGGGAVGFTLDNLYLRELEEEDRSVNNTGLAVYGTITKSPVATGAELVGYSGFSNNANYLRQPYNSGLDFGTGDWSIMAWIKTTRTSGYGDVVHRSDAGSTGYASMSDGSWFWQIFPNRTYGFYFRTAGGASSGATVSTALVSGVWTHVTIVRTGSILRFYHNGILVNTNGPSSNISASWSDSTSSMSLKMGWQGPSYNYPADQETLSLVRISKSAPSAEQIKKIYEDEKVLFQENAACTLYGSSDAVTALAYDEVTEQLHVGTSSGRSDFQGLRRINNTTTAVTTAISAHDEFIVEQ